KVIKAKDINNDKVFLVLGPWRHGGGIDEGSNLGPIRFGSDTALHFRQEILRPFLDHYLKDDAPKMDVAPVSAFETGSNKWRSLNNWPAGCVSGCAIKPTPLHLAEGQKASFLPPAAGSAGFDEYVSDPAKPVPYRARPILPVGYDEMKGQTWPRWLVDDQREASGRTDVLSFTTDVLKTPVKISGEPIAHLLASTSGTDADWVVKVIDLYPDEVPSQPAMGGYQLMISADIFRGRYREGFETAKPITANKMLPYSFALPTANHVFLPGHRIMVQIQSSWFPLYDRNPQTFVPNIFWAKPDDYKKATQHVFHGPGQDSYIELPLVEAVR
ncbi:MAG TPA: CocE/NonD family hydrolase, partial [Burkholderiaceae bacterium]